MKERLKAANNEVKRALWKLAEELDDPKLFPEQSSFFCSGCSKDHSFGYVLRYISDRI